jgi:hypothetical protein
MPSRNVVLTAAAFAAGATWAQHAGTHRVLSLTYTGGWAR